MKILLAITFVFGVLKLLSFTKLLERTIDDVFEVIFKTSNKELAQLWELLNIWFFYFSLIFQAWYWLFK